MHNIQLPVIIRHIRAWAFTWCSSLEQIDLPEQLQSIENDAFLSAGLRSVYIPAATTSIATTAISACQQLTSVVVDPANPVYDSRDNCNAIIETKTNMMVSGSAVARIPRSVTSLSDDCFNMFHLKELIIPAQITRIGPWTLATHIGRLYLESPVPPYYDTQGGTLSLVHDDSDGCPLPDVFVPAGSADAYRNAEGWCYYSDHIHEYQPEKEQVQ